MFSTTAFQDGETLNLKNRSGTLVVGEQTPYG
jgi:hypothetical protein